MIKGQVIVIGKDVESVYDWIDSKSLEIDDVRVVVTPDQMKGCKPKYVVLVPGWTHNRHIGEILEMLLDLDRA